MPLIITQPGKLPNILQIALKIIVNVTRYQSMQLMTYRNWRVLKHLPPPTLNERFRCSEQEAGDLNRFPVTVEPLLQFTDLDEMMEPSYLDLAISGTD